MVRDLAEARESQMRSKLQLLAEVAQVRSTCCAVFNESCLCHRIVFMVHSQPACMGSTRVVGDIRTNLWLLAAPVQALPEAATCPVHAAGAHRV